MGGKVKWVLLVSVVTIALTGCKTAEEKQVLEEKKDFRLLYTYEEDREREDRRKTLTDEELVEELVLNELGIGSASEGFREDGILKGQGIFVESAIMDGTSIPKVSPIKNNILLYNNMYMEEQKLSNRQEYLELLAIRENILKGYNNEDEGYVKWLEDEFERKVKEQNGEKVAPSSKNNFEDSWGNTSITNSKEFELEKKLAREKLEKEEERQKLKAEINQLDIDDKEKENLKRNKEILEQEEKEKLELDKKLEEEINKRRGGKKEENNEKE